MASPMPLVEPVTRAWRWASDIGNLLSITATGAVRARRSYCIADEAFEGYFWREPPQAGRMTISPRALRTRPGKTQDGAAGKG